MWLSPFPIQPIVNIELIFFFDLLYSSKGTVVGNLNTFLFFFLTHLYNSLLPTTTLSEINTRIFVENFVNGLR